MRFHPGARAVIVTVKEVREKTRDTIIYEDSALLSSSASFYHHPRGGSLTPKHIRKPERKPVSMTKPIPVIPEMKFLIQFLAGIPERECN